MPQDPDLEPIAGGPSRIVDDVGGRRFRPVKGTSAGYLVVARGIGNLRCDSVFAIIGSDRCRAIVAWVKGRAGASKLRAALSCCSF